MEHQLRPVFGEDGIRAAIRQAFDHVDKGEASKDSMILSEEATIDALIKRYSASAVSHRTTGITRTEEELQEQLAWYRDMIPQIVREEFQRYNKKHMEVKIKQ